MKRFFTACLCSAVLIAASYADATISYTVKKGDTLNTIAKKHHVSIPAIKSANNLKSIKLSIGTRLVIPDKSDNSVRSRTARSEQPSSSQKAFHQVRKGETLETIAKKYGISERDLREINTLGTSRVKPGMKLALVREDTKTHVVRKGDTIRRVATKYNTTAENIRSMNSLSGNSLKPGQRIIVAKSQNEEVEDDRHSVVSTQKVPVIAAVRLDEVHELSNSEDITQLSVKDRLILFAKKMLHLPYRFGGNGSVGLDCSGYVQKVFNFAGISLPRSAREQYTIGEAIDKEEMKIGDLVFFRTYASFPSHVGIYLGNNLFIHASSRSKRVTIDSLETPYYVKRFIGAKRLVSPEMQGTIGEAVLQEQ